MRESSSAQIRTLLNEQRKTIIGEYCEKVSHHELFAAQLEFCFKLERNLAVVALFLNVESQLVANFPMGTEELAVTIRTL